MYAIIPAAGSGLRLQNLGKDRGKSLLQLESEGVPLIELTLRRVVEADICKGIVVVTRQEDQKEIAALTKRLCVGCDYEVVNGGATRQESVFNGLMAVRGRAQYVLVHDGARPFCPIEVLKRTVVEVREHKAVLVATKVASTVKEVDNNLIIQKTVSRESLWLAQTPQAFDCELLLMAHEKAKTDGFFGTDDCQLVERMGHQIKIVPGSEINIKITTPADINLARAIVRGEFL